MANQAQPQGPQKNAGNRDQNFNSPKQPLDNERGQEKRKDWDEQQSNPSKRANSDIQTESRNSRSSEPSVPDRDLDAPEEFESDDEDTPEVKPSGPWL
jgi:hypothetical protein